MKDLIAIALIAGALAVAAPASVDTAAAASMQAVSKTGAASAADFIVRRRYHRHGDRSDDRPCPTYYARPSYYRPYPYSSPAPFTFGFGFGPLW